jgi:hypothetical protein
VGGEQTPAAARRMTFLKKISARAVKWIDRLKDFTIL